MERKPETESGSFHVALQADGKHELQRLLKISAWGLCLQRDLTRLAGLKMLRWLLKTRSLEVKWGTSPGPEYRRGSQRFNKTGAGPARPGAYRPFNRSRKGLKVEQDLESGEGGGITLLKGAGSRDGEL